MAKFGFGSRYEARFLDRGRTVLLGRTQTSGLLPGLAADGAHRLPHSKSAKHSRSMNDARGLQFKSLLADDDPDGSEDDEIQEVLGAPDENADAPRIGSLQKQLSQQLSKDDYRQLKNEEIKEESHDSKTQSVTMTSDIINATGIANRLAKRR